MDLLNKIKQHKKPIIIASGVFVLVLTIIWVLTLFWHNIVGTGTLSLNVAPYDATITINDELYSSGEHTLPAGNYTVSVEKTDFEPQTVDFVIEVARDTIVTVALDPIDRVNTWYTDHPEDGLIYSQVGDQEAEAAEADFVQQFPIMQYVPYRETSEDKLRNNRFKVDAAYDGRSVKLLVTLNSCSERATEAYRQAAEDWLNSLGIDLTPYVVDFTTVCG
jgi:hypothetical protein